MTANQYGKESRLTLHVAAKGGRSQLQKVSFTAPFKITSPFYDQDDHLRVMMMSVSAGIMAGDRQAVEIAVGEGSRAEIFSQSFEKIHKMAPEARAERKTKLTVAPGGLLMYSPLPTIPYADSAFRSETEVVLADRTARLCYSEIIACGRAARQERFKFREYRSLTKVWREGVLCYYDNAVYLPGETDMESFCMFEGYSHLSNMLLFQPDISAADKAQLRQLTVEFPGVSAGMTETGNGDLCIRALGSGSEPLLELHQKIRSILGY